MKRSHLCLALKRPPAAEPRGPVSSCPPDSGSPSPGCRHLTHPALHRRGQMSLGGSPGPWRRKRWVHPARGRWGSQAWVVGLAGVVVQGLRRPQGAAQAWQGQEVWTWAAGPGQGHGRAVRAARVVDPHQVPAWGPLLWPLLLLLPSILPCTLRSSPLPPVPPLAPKPFLCALGLGLDSVGRGGSSPGFCFQNLSLQSLGKALRALESGGGRGDDLRGWVGEGVQCRNGDPEG